ncbi:Caspase-3 [Oopsacas minuta]|uniref:Caspase-3 n=1 Tax=Oopsacas minuta TaxID=111878 RepID=A0AAV7KBU6_9METZ|nr:Caspase-3 [Oopsacas minuta]
MTSQSISDENFRQLGLSGANTPPLDSDSDGELIVMDTPVSFVKSKTSPNPYTQSFNENEFQISIEALNSNPHISQHNAKCGLCLIIIFESCEIDLLQARLKSKQIEKTLTFLNFNVKILDTAYIRDHQKLKFSNVKAGIYDVSKYKALPLLIDEAIASSPSLNSLVVFCIGQAVSIKDSRGILSYKFHEGLDSNPVYSHTFLINKIASLVSSEAAMPVLLFFDYISQANSPPTPEKNICTNTLFCYSSSHQSSLSPGIKPHQPVVSLFETLRKTQSKSQLINLFLNTRDTYYQFLESCSHYSGANNVFFIQNTLRQYIYLSRNANVQGQDDVTASSSSQGLFMVLTNENFTQSNLNFIPELIENIKIEFQLMNFRIAQDILLVGKSSYTQTINKNKNLCGKCSLVVVLILTCDIEQHQVSLNDKTSLKVNIFSNELANSFPDIPRAIFLSQLVSNCNSEAVKKFQPSTYSYPTNYKNMMIVHAIDKTLSGANSSLLANFILSIQKNYFSELHTILYDSIVESRKSEYIQVIDGLVGGFNFSSNKDLSSILNIEGDAFRRAYMMACLEGSEPFRFYRLMIVGPEGVGKTSLLRNLTGLPFKIDEESTPFINKFDLQVHKISQDWEQIEDLMTYTNNLEETRQDMAVKYMTQEYLEYDKKLQNEFCLRNHSFSEHKTFIPESDNSKSSNIFDSQEHFLSPSLNPRGEELNLLTEEKFDDYLGSQVDSAAVAPTLFEENSKDFAKSIPVQKIHATLRGTDELSSKSNFLTAWDFAGQNYLYCFHSLFLSPRAIYLLLVDLSVDELTNPINVRTERMDRHTLRSQIGVPTTYLEAIEFWLNAIFSVSKTASNDIYQRPAKIIFVFSKSDCVINPIKRAEKHLETIRSHMNRRNNAFSLVHEDDGLFLISCLPESPYISGISKLKDIVKQLSDHIAFQQSIPIKWIELANIILREELPIINHRRICFLAESCSCLKDLEYFLHLFHDIGFFFYKQGIIITDVQKFLDLIYHIVSPQYGSALLERFTNTNTEILVRDLRICQSEAKLSCNLLEYILNSLNLRVLKDSLLDLLKIYGILIDSQSEEGLSNYYYVPYLFTTSSKKLVSLLPNHRFFSSFYLFFPDGFIPASLYFTLLSYCIRRNVEKNLSLPIFGFDCAFFYVCPSLLVAIEFCIDKPYIQINFSKINSLEEQENPYADQYDKSEIMDYLIFLQMLIIDIQGKLIPCGNLAKVVLDCTCDRLSDLDRMEHPCICLDQLLLTDSRARESWCYNKQCKINWNHIFNDNDFLLDYITKFYDNTSIAKFIFNNQDTFIQHINSQDLSPLLYKFGLASSERIYAINNKGYSQVENSANLLEELVHKGPLWAVKLYVVLCREYRNPGHQFLRSLIDKNISKGLITPLTFHNSKNIDRQPHHDRYRMNSNPHGIAFLVNIEIFATDQASVRKGSKLDLISLRDTFEHLQYVVIAKENLTKAEFKKEIIKIARLDHSSYDSFFCVVMSHGDEDDNILLSDGKKISRDEITSEFSNIYCESLAGKPKIFILQACRGSKIEVFQLRENKLSHRKYMFFSEYGNNIMKNNQVREDSEISTSGKEQLHPTIHPLRILLNPTGSIDEEPENLSALSDIFIGNSTVQRYSSFRHTSHGSIFIQSFCLVLQYCRYEEFLHIMTEVRRRVSLLSQTFSQCTEDISHLRKKLYF